MGNVISRVPELLKKRGWGAMDLVRRANVGIGTAYKLAAGDADFSIQTLGKLCAVFGVPIEKIISFSPDEEQSGS